MTDAVLVFLINFERIPYIFLVFLSLTSNKQMLAGLCFENTGKKNVINYSD